MSSNCNICINRKFPSYSATCVECELSRKNFKPITNADRMRAMTDEELAEWIARHMYCEECMNFNDETGTCNYKNRYGGCNGAMLEWLKQNAEEQ